MDVASADYRSETSQEIESRAVIVERGPSIILRNMRQLKE
jgi:hypothetical protein